jgi:hypothetical protein
MGNATHAAERQATMRPMRPTWKLEAPFAMLLSLALLGGACADGAAPRTTGGAGTSGAAGSGPAGTGTPGTAGISGEAGTSGAAGDGTGIAGTSGAAGDGGGAAGTSGGAGTNAAAGTSGNAGTSGAAGTGAAAGTSGAAGAAAGMGGGACATDSPPGDAGGAPGIGCDTPRPPKPAIDATKHSFRFTAASLDPMANSGHQTSMQIAEVDTSKAKWKLCIVLPGIGNGPGLGLGAWMANQGYHVFQVAYDSALSGAPNGETSPDVVGNTRMNQFDAKGRTPGGQVTRSNSIEYRTILALKHLKEVDPMGGWGWYLGPDGNSVRWSDGCAVGYSYGATHAAIISVYVRLGLVVSTSGPWWEGHADSTFLTTPSATPGNRAFALFGMQDGRYADYTKAATSMGWVGPVVTTTSNAAKPATKPWYGGSHIINVTDQGHTEFCAGDHPYCSWAFFLDGH